MKVHAICKAKGLVYLKMLQNSQENTCDEVSFLKKCQPFQLAILLKTMLRHKFFSVKSAKLFSVAI